MSKKKNKNILESITNINTLSLKPEALVDQMMEQEVAGQRVFYLYLQQNGYDISPEAMDKNQTDGIFKNAIIECKLNGSEGGGAKKAYKELYEIIPRRLKQKGEKIPFYRIYVELQTFETEVYDCHCKLKEKFNWYTDYGKFKKYFNDTTETFEYDLLDEDVDLVEVIQNLYKMMSITTKVDAYTYLKKGMPGWFKPFDYEKEDINRLILNNDKMNEKYVQKIEGAFFTPSRYVEISTNYVLNAIKQSKIDGYDNYIIIDRCAGVGNLESKFDNEIYSHLILGTINEAEVMTANIRFGDKATVHKIDALTKEGVEYYKQAIEEYKNKNKVKKLAIIFLENPPYAQTNSNKKGGVGYSEDFKKNGKYIKTWVHQQMQRGGEDLDEQFCFSAFEYYDLYAYIHFGPIKIWKSRNLINKEVKECYLCNKKYFNAQESAIALIYWTNKDKIYEELVFDNDFKEPFSVKKVHHTISELYSDDGEENGVCVIEARNFSFSSPRLTGSINSTKKYGKKWVSKENLLSVLPLFCASRDEISENGNIEVGKKDYRIVDTIYKTSDGGKKYVTDKPFLQNCLLYSLCTQKNACESMSKFWGVAEELLEKEYKQNEIYVIYKNLVNQTKLNGLANIEKYNKVEYGKLWKEHELYPSIRKLKKLLDKLHREEIRPNLLKYEILK